MSMSLRDQLLAAGLVSQKQVREAERQQQHQERAQHQSKQKRRPPNNQPQAANKPGTVAPGNASAHASTAPPGPVNAGLVTGAAASAASRHAAAQSAKVARDLALNKKHQEKAEKKARAAQIKQLIDQNRVVRGETDERYNFVDGGRVRFIAANADVRRRLMAGELCIVRHDGVFDVVPAAVAQRIRERDERAVIHAAAFASADTPPVDDAYRDFAVPDDLMW
jgi:uncharacterized protein YaiL (DUF2058 family)